MGNEKLRALQLCELDILKEFVRICQENNIRYYLAWGTLLGAIRHRGFIPWDDDIDVCMPFKDYLRFKEICSQQLSPDYFYEDWYEHHDYFLYWAKLRKNHTTCMTRSEADLKIHWGVGIDIFPLFDMDKPSLSFSKKLARQFLEFSVKRAYLPYGANGLKKKLKKILYMIVPKKADSWIICHALSSLNKASSNAKYLCDLSGNSFWPKEVFGEGAIASFEGEEMITPKDSDAYLKKAYGSDYMQIPKVEDRIDHGDLIVDLENDYSMYQSEV